MESGRKLRDALIKALRLRNLHCQMCEVRTMDGKLIIPWDMDLSQISARAVQVLQRDTRPKLWSSSDECNEDLLWPKTSDENWVSGSF